MSTLPLVLRAALLGVAAGGRTTAPGVVLAWAPPPSPGPLRRLTGTRGRLGAAVAFAGELVGDKLPQTPSRLDPPALAGRVVSGAVAGAALALKDHPQPLGSLLRGPVGLGALVAGGAGAVAGSYLGSAWRASAPFASDVPAALLEDAAVLAAASVAVRG